MPKTWFKNLQSWYRSVWLGWPLTYRLALVAAVLVLLFSFVATQAKPGGQPSKLVQLIQPTLMISPLDGLSYEAESAGRHPLGVMIENHPESRPQSGLSQAAIVYEALAEGGITRFLAIFGPNLPERVGPVRSARPYYLDWCLEYDCYYAHVGGNVTALDLIPKLGIKDLDQFRYGVASYGRIFYRQPKKGIATEHTMYADPLALYRQAEKNWGQAAALSPRFKRAQSLPSEVTATNGRQTANLVKIAISSQQFNPSYRYLPEQKRYQRLLADQPQLDALGNQAIEVSNIIIQEVASQAVKSRINEKGLALTTVGNGKGYFLARGLIEPITWQKAASDQPTKFFDQAKQELKLLPGKTWISVVNPGTKLTVE